MDVGCAEVGEDGEDTAVAVVGLGEVSAECPQWMAAKLGVIARS